MSRRTWESSLLQESAITTAEQPNKFNFIWGTFKSVQDSHVKTCPQQPDGTSVTHILPSQVTWLFGYTSFLCPVLTSTSVPSSLLGDFVIVYRYGLQHLLVLTSQQEPGWMGCAPLLHGLALDVDGDPLRAGPAGARLFARVLRQAQPQLRRCVLR